MIVDVPDQAMLALATEQLRAWHETQGVRSGRGLEALIAGATLGVSRRHWLLPGQREQGCAILRGASPDRLHATRPYRVLPPGASPAQRALTAVGLALSNGPVLVFLGSGSLSYGGAFQALALSVSLQAPVTFVVSWYDPMAVNGAPFAPQLPIGPATLALALGLEAIEVDGSDAAAVQVAVAGSGPRLVEARLPGNG